MTFQKIEFRVIRRYNDLIYSAKSLVFRKKGTIYIF